MSSKSEPTLQLSRPVSKIVVLRANGLGDFLFATPALRVLARSFPEAEVTLLCHPALHGFIADRYPYIHRTVPLPYYPNLNNPPPGESIDEAAVKAFFEWARTEHFDLAIQMHGGGVQSNPFVARLGARHTLGLAGRGVQRLETNLRYVFYQSEVLRYLELVSLLGVSWEGLDDLRVELPLLSSDFSELGSHPRLGGDRRYVVLHPGAGDPRRRWPFERFARVAEVIYERFGRTVVVGGNHAERPLANRVAGQARVPVVNVAGGLGLGAYAALLAGADLFVGNDTGPSHVAFALEVPSVVVYWCGNVITAGPPTRRIFRPVLSWTVDCPACGRRNCRCRVSFVADASLEEVVEQVEDLLSAEDTTTPPAPLSLWRGTGGVAENKRSRHSGG